MNVLYGASIGLGESNELGNVVIISRSRVSVCGCLPSGDSEGEGGGEWGGGEGEGGGEWGGGEGERVPAHITSWRQTHQVRGVVICVALVISLFSAPPSECAKPVVGEPWKLLCNCISIWH